MNVRRQGHLTQPVQYILEYALVEEAHRAPAVLADGQGLRNQVAVAEYEPRTGLCLFAGLENDLPVREVQTA